jgi:hypothetical protein
MDTTKRLPNKVLIPCIIIGSLLFAVAVSALAFGPNDREESFIELGMLKEAQSNEHEQADDKRSDIADLEAEIATHGANYATYELEIQDLEASLFTSNQ